jgi:dipeptidyl aminopeptidase/acylaminoacyl peptidase
LCLNYNIVIALLDGRGTDGNGENYMKSIYKRLGELETLDQFNLAKELKKQVYTDSNKFAIMGWSFGGFIAGMALFNESSEFNCSISGAPVTDWSFYG